MNMNANDALREALTSHGLAVGSADGWLEPAGSKAILRARSYSTSSGPEGTVARLDVQVGLPSGRLLTESNGAPGATEEEATVVCMGKFVAGSLHPILGAFFGHRDHQEIERWSIRGVEYEAFLGPVLAQTSEAVPPRAPALGPLVRELTGVRTGVSRRAHWIRIFYAQVGKQPATFEALWDGERWPEMVEALKRLEWPDVAGYFSARQFLVIAPLAVEPASEPEPGYRAVEKAVELMVAACAKDRGLNDDAVFEQLVAGGVDAAVAEDAIHFAPLGFTAVLFRGCQLSPDYQVMDSSNEIVATRPLVEEPIFTAAREVAAQLTELADGRDRFMAVASRCSRFVAANQALATGAKLEDLSFPAPILFRDQKPRATTALAPDEKPRAPAPKPWWKVW